MNERRVQQAIETLLESHPLEYTPKKGESYRRCPACEQWSPCDVRIVIEALRAFTGPDRCQAFVPTLYPGTPMVQCAKPIHHDEVEHEGPGPHGPITWYPVKIATMTKTTTAEPTAIEFAQAHRLAENASWNIHVYDGVEGMKIVARKYHDSWTFHTPAEFIEWANRGAK
jgi:hypothetical protein